MAKGLDDMIQKLNRIENHLGEEIAPDVNKLFKISVYKSLIEWYGDYSGSYNRTYNLMKITDSARSSGKGNVINMSVDSGHMNNYPGFFGQPMNSYYIPKPEDHKFNGQKLNASIAFDFMFLNGEHGHGKWQAAISTPPYRYVDSQIESGFDGQVYNIINQKIESILGI